MSINQVREPFEGRQPLPAEGLPPRLEEFASPRHAPIVPQLRELCFQNVGRVEAFVRGPQRGEGGALGRRQIFAMRQQHILLPFDEATIRTIGEALVFGLPHVNERAPQLPQHMKLVIQNRGVRRLGARRLPKRSDTHGLSESKFRQAISSAKVKTDAVDAESVGGPCGLCEWTGQHAAGRQCAILADRPGCIAQTLYVSCLTAIAARATCITFRTGRSRTPYTHSKKSSVKRNRTRDTEVGKH